MAVTDFLLLAFIFLIAGVISVPIASRLGLGSVLGYLIAGIVISPILAVLGVDVVSIQHFAEFGVVMMLFLVGLELEPKHLWDMRGRLLGLGGGQIALSTLAIMGVSMLFGLSWSVALTVGLVLALSSTAIGASFTWLMNKLNVVSALRVPSDAFRRIPIVPAKFAGGVPVKVAPSNESQPGKAEPSSSVAVTVSASPSTSSKRPVGSVKLT